MTRIFLVRHARSSHVHDGRWMNADGVREYERAYNAAGIVDTIPPPAEVLEAAAHAEIIAASDLPRAIASARRLAPDRELAISPLLREVSLEPPPWVTFRLPEFAWDLHNYLQHTVRLLRGSDHENTRRAHAAADWLLERVNGTSTLLAITHGGFRRFLDVQLAARGWSCTTARKSYANWSVWCYAR